MKTSGRRGFTVAAALAGLALVASPMDADTASALRFKPPIPCVAVRAGITRWVGYCHQRPAMYLRTSSGAVGHAGHPVSVWALP